ncbi:MAG TPA: OsmC family protein [Steroidobacteraceae bacterium]|nr:OsmC family protein [Steroidobacteraceae bacterium]
MSAHSATVVWERPAGAAFKDNKYSRAHEWRFDGGTVVPASSSPHVVPLPLSRADAVDPEEAFIAALSSCHMLFFLSYAARAGLVIDSYEDDAVGETGKNAAGALAMLRVQLRPKITWADKTPSATELDDLHHRSHASCYIANSVTTQVSIEPR